MHPTALNHLRRLERADLEVLLGMLNGSRRALRRDDSGDWNIIGGRGRIVCCNGTFTITIDPRTSRRWRSTKRQLADFTACVQDGDGEGVLKLTRLPQGGEVESLRDVIGLRQARPGAADHLTRFRFPPPSEGGFNANYAPKPTGGCRTLGQVKGRSVASRRPLEGMASDQEAAE